GGGGPMRGLVLETERHAADAAVHSLEAAGHHVARCHEGDLSAFPCNALCAEGKCPIEDGQSVDVVLTLRNHAYPRRTAFDDGVTCALRHGLPLVVGGVTALNPFDKWTTAIASTGDDIVRACKFAANGPIERLSGPARAEIHRRLRRANAPTD